LTVTRIYLDPSNKWAIVVEGVEKNKPSKTYIAIPPTNGNRVDVISTVTQKSGYNYDTEVIVVNVVNGNPRVELFSGKV